MTEPRAASFHGDLTRIGNPARAAPKNSEVVGTTRGVEWIVGHHHSGPNVLDQRSTWTAKVPKVVER